jgi:hypothetical protein
MIILSKMFLPFLYLLSEISEKKKVVQKSDIYHNKITKRKKRHNCKRHPFLRFIKERRRKLFQKEAEKQLLLLPKKQGKKKQRRG